VAKVITDMKQENLAKRCGPNFEEFLRNQIRMNRKTEEAKSEETSNQQTSMSDQQLLASQLNVMNNLIATKKEEKKFSDFEKERIRNAYTN
jgi:hypothetical protein